VGQVLRGEQAAGPVREYELMRCGVDVFGGVFPVLTEQGDGYAVETDDPVAGFAFGSADLDASAVLADLAGDGQQTLFEVDVAPA
jgi:hypothetical protein